MQRVHSNTLNYDRADAYCVSQPLVKANSTPRSAHDDEDDDDCGVACVPSTHLYESLMETTT